MSAMPPTEQARARLAARRRRTRAIRRGVGAATVATFALAWGLIAHDGSMGTTATASTTTGGDTSSGSSTATDQDSSSGTTIAPDAPATTTQS